ncbi:hypothetical protein E3E22_10655 [Thermococcus sp. MV5]|nr:MULTISPECIES: hypothetical protein [unclassified Thermococcus]NJE06626.1 hypothetical protein [Thermococcus sp. M36]NJE27060.1 hypothetical protein [Thermococcus sp. MV5]NJE55633.1 hypothetical protein [Thermococcus sp. 21S9]
MEAEAVNGPISIKMPDNRTNNNPNDSKTTSEENLKATINQEIYNNMRFYMKMLYENAATETDVILLKALWREIKRMMKINGIEIEEKKQK